MRVLVTGSRDWPDRDIVFRRLDALHAICPDGHTFVVVHGDCPTGADRHARQWCEVMLSNEVGGSPVVEERHPAQWQRLGKSAGFKRNAEMVALGADWCLAFILDGSRGATHTHGLATRADIRTNLDTLNSIGGQS